MRDSLLKFLDPKDTVKLFCEASNPVLRGGFVVIWSNKQSSDPEGPGQAYALVDHILSTAISAG
jgi:hypothetical protein